MNTKFYICRTCGNIIEKINDSGVPVVCCGKPSENANAYALRVAGCADIIEESLMHKDADYLSSAIDSIIGLGLGLTPSGDDFITGMMFHGRTE